MLSPSWTTAIAAGLVGIGVVLGIGSNFGRDSRLTGQPFQVADARHLPASADTLVTFVFPAPTAARVSVVGDFNAWNSSATPMQRLGNTGLWSVTVPMSVGRHIYSYFAVTTDGEKWSADPFAPSAPDDGFGRANSVVLVGKGSTL
jgi:1,4-alpha-glucan branching enzyme